MAGFWICRFFAITGYIFIHLPAWQDIAMVSSSLAQTTLTPVDRFKKQRIAKSSALSVAAIDLVPSIDQLRTVPKPAQQASGGSRSFTGVLVYANCKTLVPTNHNSRF
jgi:hypothetical protein